MKLNFLTYVKLYNHTHSSVQNVYCGEKKNRMQGKYPVWNTLVVLLSCRLKIEGKLIKTRLLSAGKKHQTKPMSTSNESVELFSILSWQRGFSTWSDFFLCCPVFIFFFFYTLDIRNKIKTTIFTQWFSTLSHGLSAAGWRGWCVICQSVCFPHVQ